LIDPKLAEFTTKLNRIYKLMDAENYEAIVIGTQTNFSWLSCGGSSRVLLTTDAAAVYLVITENDRYVVAHTMDGPRNLEEELQGMGFKAKFRKWIDEPLEDVILNIVNGRKILSDIPIGGEPGRPTAFYQLHYPLTEGDMERYREIDHDAERLMRSVVDNTKPGMLETEVETLMMCEYAKAGFFPVVLLVGSDERLFKYRHMTPQSKPIENYLMIIVAFRKYGLNAVLTRSVYFGDHLPNEIADKFEAASIIEANCIAHSTPGTKFASILKMQKELYAELGYREEWKNHFQGGITGYVVNDSSLCLDPKITMVKNQAYNWFITITGVNTEDTFLSYGEDGEILTTTGAWPLKVYQTRNGKEVKLPKILIK